MKTTIKYITFVCLLWTNILMAGSQGLYRQSQTPPSGSAKVVPDREDPAGFLFESKSALTTKPTDLPEDVGLSVGDGLLILLALVGGYGVYRRAVVRNEE
ncbi:MAG: hypothetical protein LBM08_15330 [Dysgonamonadaceae bacterium]|jgi:hypothetical protein|nr:hypothetical protein [Dysgonamonadaceae bacterium]